MKLNYRPFVVTGVLIGSLAFGSSVALAGTNFYDGTVSCAGNQVGKTTMGYLGDGHIKPAGVSSSQSLYAGTWSTASRLGLRAGYWMATADAVATAYTGCVRAPS